MNLIQEDIQYEFLRMTYWVRVHLKFENRQSVVLVCASKNYISDYFHLTAPIQEADKKAWMKKVLADLEKEGENLLENDVNYKVYSLTNEGHINGLEFLQKEVTP